MKRIIFFKEELFLILRKTALLNLIFLPFFLYGQGKPELVVQVGHSGTTHGISLSPDGRKLLTCSGDKTVKLWDIYVGKEVRTYVGHKHEIYTVMFAPDGKSFISGGYYGEIIWWDIETGEIRKKFQSNALTVKNLFFTGDMKKIIAGCSGSIKIWDTETGKEIKTISNSDGVISITQDGSKIAGSYIHTINIWDINTGIKLKTLSGHKDEVLSISISPDGKRIVSCSMGFGKDRKDETKYWNAETGAEILLTDFNLKTDRSVAFSPDGKKIAAGGQSNNIMIWSNDNGRKIKSLSCNSAIMSLLFSSDSKKIVAVERDNSVHIWDIESGQEARILKGYSKTVLSLAVGKDNGQFASSSGKDVVVWDLKAGKIKNILFGDKEYVFALNYSPDQKKIISGSGDHKVMTWDIETGIQDLSFPSGNYEISSVSFSPDGKKLLTSNKDKTIKLWDAMSGKELMSFTGQKSGVNSVAFSPDGNKIVAASGDPNRDFITSPDDIRIWDAQTGKELIKIGENRDWYTSASFSPDGKSILSSSLYKKNCCLWDSQTGMELKAFNGHTNEVYIAVFSPDGKKIISGGLDNTVKLWDVESGSEIKTFSGHKKSVVALSVTSDGKRILSGSIDCSVKLWDIESGNEIVSFVHVGKNDFIISTPDNYYIASRGAFNGVAFRVSNNAFPFEQFDLKYNRPDIVLQKLGYTDPNVIASYKNAYLKRLKKLNFTEDMLGSDFHLPEIEITTQNLPVSTDNKSFSFSIKATDSKYLLDRVNVYINDVPVYGSKGIDLRTKKTNSYEQDILLQLLNGSNKIQVSVLNNKGVESLKKTFFIKYIGVETKPELYIVSIGVSNFIEKQYNLTYAAKDANDIAETFKSNPLFSKVNIFSFTDNNAIKASIIKVKEVLKKSKPDDVVLLFVASHGLLDDKMNYYIATHNINFNNSSQNGLPYEELESLLDGIPAMKKIMLIDACHSGEVDKDEMILADATMNQGTVKSRGFKAVKKKENQLGIQNSFELMNELFADLRRGTGAVVISSAGGAEFAFESNEWKNGVFTYSVLEGLKTGNADANKNKEITVSELRDYVFKRVKELTNGKQNPTSRQENLEFDFRLW